MQELISKEIKKVFNIQYSIFNRVYSICWLVVQLKTNPRIVKVVIEKYVYQLSQRGKKYIYRPYIIRIKELKKLCDVRKRDGM